MLMKVLRYVFVDIRVLIFSADESMSHMLLHLDDSITISNVSGIKDFYCDCPKAR